MDIDNQSPQKEAHLDNGLIYGFLLDGKGGGRIIGYDDLDSLSSGAGIPWLHLDFENPIAQKWLKEKSGLHEASCESLLADDTRPRVYAGLEGVLGSFRGINFNPGAEPDDMISLRLWLEPGRIISLRRRKVLAIQDIAQSVQTGTGPGTTGEFLALLTRNLTNRIAESVSDIEDKVDELEERTDFGNRRELRAQLADIRRTAVGIRRYIVPQREALAKAGSENIPWLSEIDRMRLRESAERTMRYVEDLDAVRERAAIFQEEISSRISDQMNRTMYIMSIVATIFLPLGLLTGLLGINVGGLPGAQWNAAFWVVCGIMVGLAIFEYWLFKRKNII